MRDRGEGLDGGGRAQSGLRRLLLRVFQVEEHPEPPPGSPESLRVFRASPRFFRYSLLKWALGQGGALLGLIGSTIGFEFVEFGSWSRITAAAGPLLIVLFLVQAPASYLVLRLGYEMRWYMVNDRALRIRYGIYSVREQTMTVVNIQNMAVKRGPLQRLFRIADLEIRTASGGGSDDDDDALSRGLLQGLDNAEQVRDLLLASLRRSRDAGLGDPDDHAADLAVPVSSADTAVPPAAGDGPVLAAARELLAESRALRRTVAGGGP